MASIGHIAVGMAAARFHRDTAAGRWTSTAWWSALALAPDVDVIGFALGVEYGDPWGHRGATHSIAFALAAAAGLAIAAPKLQLPPLRTWSIASLVLVSHGLLDTLTDGGLGCALLWPFDLTRYFAPWRPIPVAPIGLDYFSPDGLFVALTELILFAPLVVFALRPARIAWALLPVWSVAVWLIASTDQVREAALGLVLREHTEYAGGFSEQAFRTIEVGQSDEDVRRSVGAPLGEWLEYFDDQEPATGKEVGCPFLYLESDRVAADSRDIGPAATMCAQRGIRLGMSRGEVIRVLGPPRFVCWRYSRSPSGQYHRARVVCFADAKVVAVLRRWESG